MCSEKSLEENQGQAAKQVFQAIVAFVPHAYAVIVLEVVNTLSVIVLSTPGWNFDRVTAKPVGNREAKNWP